MDERRRGQFISPGMSGAVMVIDDVMKWLKQGAY
jgi:hypothetical protein